MINFREVNDYDILKDWFNYRDETELSTLSEEDKKHPLLLEEHFKRILNSIPKQNRKFVEKELNAIDDNFADYLIYYTEKYYRNGFVDGSQIAMGCFEEQ